MKTFKLLILLTMSALMVLPPLLSAQTPEWSWATDSEGEGSEFLYRIATNEDGSVYALGTFMAPFTLGDLQVEEDFGLFIDSYVARFSPGGTPEWIISVGQPGFGFIILSGLTSDSQGNVYVSGDISREFPPDGEAVFALGDETIAFPDGVSNAAFIAKIAPDGEVLWLNAYSGLIMGGGPTGSNSRLVMDETEHIYLAADFSQTIEINGTTLTNMGGSDHLLCRLDTDGNFDWATSLGSPENDFGLEMTSCQGGGVLMCSGWTGDTAFVGGLHVVNPDAINGGSIFEENNRDRWIAKVNSNGTAEWLVREGGLLSEEVGRLATTPDGGAMVLSYQLTPIDIGGQSIETTGWLLTRYSNSGELENVVHFPTELSWTEGYPSIVGLGDDNYAIAVNYSAPSLTIGDVQLNNAGGANGTVDAAVAAIDQNGVPLWVVEVGADDSENLRALAVSQSGEIFLGGTYSSMELGLGEITLQNSGTFTEDFFVAKLDVTTGIFESDRVQGLELYPNPAKSQVSLDLSAFNANQVTIRIIDCRGAVVGVQNLTAGSVQTLDVDHLHAGSYAVIVIDANNIYASKLIIN